MRFKQEIEDRYQQIYGRDFFIACSLELKKSIRTNTLRITPEKLRKRLEGQRFELEEGLAKNSFVITRERKPIGATMEHLLGYFYVQEITSMIPPVWLNPEKEDKVLDMCAAPGGKTIHLSELMKNKGEIIAIDYDKTKNKAMMENLERMGTKNVTYFTMDAGRIKGMNMTFNKILLDAPCSCSGIVMKDQKISQKLSLDYIKKYAEKQKKLLKAGTDVLSENGIIVYSTCSVDPLENIGVTDYAQSELGLNLKRKKQYLPHEDGTPGFFIAELKK